MSVGQTIKTVRRQRNLKTTDLNLPYSDSMLRKIESGERRVARDVAPVLAQALDHPAVSFALAREFSGGIGPAWLDGQNVDLHRSSVREKCMEELQEAQESIARAGSSLPPGTETESARKRRTEHLLQVLDAAQACYIYVAIQCQEYEMSLTQLHRQHYNKLRSKRYVRD